MQVANRKAIMLLVALVASTMLCGCTNWKKEYQKLKVVHDNCMGLLDAEQLDKGALAEQLAESERTIADLQSKIQDQKQSPGTATGFEGYDVDFDPSAGTITVTLPNTILFRSGKATLKSATNKDLDTIVSVLQSKYSGREIDVVGHTDSDPIKKSGWRDNWQLSAERALAVTDYLTKHGMADDKVRAVACGAARPIASNSSASGKAKNRRVEIVVNLR
jgi:flagellar motor protein MotB